MVTATGLLPGGPEDSRRPSREPTLVKVGLDGKDEFGSGTDGTCAGWVVLVEPRGMGATEPPGDRVRRGSPFGPDVKEAFIAIELDRPLLGQRVTDLLTVLEGLDAESGEGGHNGFEVVGVGTAGPIVLHAALLDDRGLIKKVTLDHRSFPGAMLSGGGSAGASSAT